MHSRARLFLLKVTAISDETMKSSSNITVENSGTVMLPPELLAQIESFVEENKHLGFTTKGELIRDAIRFRLATMKGEYECMEILNEEYDKHVCRAPEPQRSRGGKDRASLREAQSSAVHESLQLPPAIRAETNIQERNRKP